MIASRWSDRHTVGRSHRRLLVLLLVSHVSRSCSFQLSLPSCRTPSTLTHPSSNERHHPLLFQHKTRQFTLSAAPLHLLSTPSVSASLALILSTSSGLLSERFLPSAGILITLTSAAVLSNVGVAPLFHPLYDLCWTLFLPASLALLLLSFHQGDTLNDPLVMKNSIRLVGIPFVVGSLGSMVGCFLSFLLCRQWPDLWLTPPNAAIAASCLCASYIGGSVNFFATSHIIGGQTSLLTSMAAADLLVMALYFAFLTGALQSRRLKALFENNVKENDGTKVVPTTLPVKGQDSSLSLEMGLATMLVVALSWVTVKIANRVDGILTRILPGTACAVICLLSTLVSRNMPPTPLWKKMQNAAKPLVQICFHLLFASIGMSANLGQALVAGPACVWFSLMALFVHIVITLGGSLIMKHFVPITLEHVLVASNAAIGGPTTAAAFCGQSSNQGLAVAATVWGVVGYAIGTGIGISLYQLLRAMI